MYAPQPEKNKTKHKNTCSNAQIYTDSHRGAVGGPHTYKAYNYGDLFHGVG